MPFPEKGKICFFLGHREAPDDLKFDLISEAKKHVRDLGVCEFVVGNHGQFDTLAARAVQVVKEERRGVRLLRLLSYHPAERTEPLPEFFDGSLYPPIERVPRQFAIVCANRWMIDHSDYLIAYVRYRGSNSCSLLEYAQRRERRGEIVITRL